MKDQPGLTAIYGLVPQAQSADDLCARHKDNAILTNRKRIRVELELALIQSQRAFREANPNWDLFKNEPEVLY
jgi:hypothetical protein